MTVTLSSLLFCVIRTSFLSSTNVGEAVSRELRTKNETESWAQCCKTSTTTGVVRKPFSSARAHQAL